MACSGLLINYLLINKSSYFKLSKNIDTIILGHSHPECAYNDSLIPNVRNLAQSGEAYLYTYLKAKKILSENKQINSVLIEFETTQIDTLMNSWTWDDAHISEKFTIYLPILDYSEFRLLWQKNSSGILSFFPKAFIKRMGHNLISILIKRKNIESDNQFGGYNYITRAKTDSLLKAVESHQKVLREDNNQMTSNINIKYLSKIINYCNQKGVHVYLIRSPLHKAYSNPNSERTFKNILNTSFSQTEFLDFKDFSLRNEQFGDFGHLNYKGAKIYSIFFNNLLNSDLLKKDNKQAFIDSEIAKIAVSQNIQN